MGQKMYVKFKKFDNLNKTFLKKTKSKLTHGLNSIYPMGQIIDRNRVFLFARSLE